VDETLNPESWTQQLAALGGTNPLISFEPSSFGQVDLSRAHPGGLAQLVSSKSTTVTNLVRDGVAGARALSAARRIKKKSDHLLQTFGVHSIFIAAGLVEISSDSRRLPILLWEARLVVKGDDFELSINPEPTLNPALHELIVQTRSDFRVADLIAVAMNQADLIPISVLGLVSELLHGPEVEIEKLLVLGNFVPDLLHLEKLSKDADQLAESLDEKSKAKSDEPASIALPLVVDADASQQKVIAGALAGNSFVVETLPGCGYLQTVVNIIAGLSIESKRVLIIAPRQQTLDEVAERLSSHGLGGLAVRNTHAWADTVSAISRNEKAKPQVPSDSQSELVDAKNKIADYFDSVSSNQNPLGISLIEAMRELAKLSAKAGAPVNSARIRPELLPMLRNSAKSILQKGYEAGVFRFGPEQSPWYKAKFETSQAVSEAIRAAKELAGEEFRTLSYQINRYLQDQKLEPCETVEDWSGQLRLLLGIRTTLDKFLPAIYDRPLHELIAATATRGNRGQLSGAQRRRFKKLAKEYIRPGSAIPNLHEGLLAAEKEREMWFRINTTQAPPTIPLGLSDTQAKFERITSALGLIQRHLDSNPDIELLTRLPFEQLAGKLEDLATKTEILHQILDRAPIVDEIEKAGLADLADELCKLNPNLERVFDEFDLAWWQSALESTISHDPRILDYTTSVVSQLEADFEKSSAALIEQGRQALIGHLAQKWHSGIRAHPAEADRLRNELRKNKLSVKSGYLESAILWKELVSAVLTSPLRVHELAATEQFDTVLVLDASSTGLAESLVSISKGSQVIAFGDPVIARPENFDTVARANQTHVKSSRISVFDFMVSKFEKMEISRNYRTQGQVLGVYLNQNFYQDRILIEPSVEQFFGNQNFEHIEIREGSAATSTIEGATESLDAEVAQVAELVLSHARWSPAESLMVVTASKAHRDRIESAVQHRLADQANLAEFFAAHGREKFEVTVMSELTHRIADRVIFSVGFGRTPEGRISGTLGDFNSDEAATWMVNQIVSARKRMSVVSCYNFEDFAAGKLPDNQIWLKDLIAPSFLSQTKDGDPDPLLADLALRLQKLGLKVALNFGGRISLAVSNGQRAAVVDADWALFGDSWDEKLRLRPGFLRAMGWEYQRVHALEIFARPQEVANRIATKLGMDLERRSVPLFDTQAFDETGAAWGDPDDNNDDRLRDEKPPHWG
jgi:hypothetical protein